MKRHNRLALWLSIVFAAVCYLFLAAEANAALISFRLSGTVTVEDELILPPDVVTGAPFTAFLRYDTSVPDQLPDDPNRGQYVVETSLGQIELVLRVDSLEIRNAPDSGASILVLDDAGLVAGLGSPIDYLTFGMPSVGGPETFLPGLSITLADTEYAAWSSDSLPTIIDLVAIEGAFIFADGGAFRERFYSIRGQITEAIRIPEPLSLLLGCWAGALFILRPNRRTH